MPYKYERDRLDNNNIKRRVKARQILTKMGLERIGQDKIICLSCRKESTKYAPHRWRHMPDCPMLPKVAEILDVPLESLKRKPKQKAYLRRPTEAEIEQRRHNSRMIAERRKNGGSSQEKAS